MSKLSIKDIVQLILLCLTLFGGVYAYAESQVQIRENKDDIKEVESEHKIVKNDLYELKTQNELKTQAYQNMSDDIKEIRDILKENFRK